MNLFDTWQQKSYQSNTIHQHFQKGQIIKIDENKNIGNVEEMCFIKGWGKGWDMVGYFQEGAGISLVGDNESSAQGLPSWIPSPSPSLYLSYG